jgi:hypothetical protein
MADLYIIIHNARRIKNNQNLISSARFPRIVRPSLILKNPLKAAPGLKKPPQDASNLPRKSPGSPGRQKPPQEGMMIPQESMMVPQEGVMVPQEGMMIPQESMIVPQESMMIPQEGVMVPQGSEIVFQEGKIISKEANHLIEPNGRFCP